MPDVCYSWWVLSSLKIIGKIHWINKVTIIFEFFLREICYYFFLNIFAFYFSMCIISFVGEIETLYFSLSR